MTASPSSPELDRRVGGLVRMALGRPVTVTMVALAAVVVGLISYVRIPLQLMPSGFTVPLLYVQVAWPNATPAEGAEQVLEPLEAALATVPGIKATRSMSRLGGLGMRVEFDDGTDMSDAYNGVRERIDRIQNDLPQGIQKIYIWKFDPDDEPVLVLAILAPQDLADAYERVQDRLARALDRLPGVGNVEIWGGTPHMVEVAIDADLAHSHGLTPYQVAEAVRRAGFVVSAGVAREAGRVLPIRVRQPLRDLQTLRELPVARDLRLQDLAHVVLAPDIDRGAVTRIDGKSALMLGVYKESRANTVDTCRLVRRTLEQVLASERALAGFSSMSLFDQGELIDESIQNLQSSLLFGGIIAVALLFVFLGRWRLTLVSAVAIPASLLGALAVLYLSGRTLNLLSLMGLMLSVGMVVDNAIVVVERIARRRQAGASVQDAAGQGTEEVALAITVATATTVAAFLPIILMSGKQELRFFLGEVGLPVCYALVASLAVAVVVVPLLTRLVGSSLDTRAHPLGVSADHVAQGYARLLRRAVQKPFDTLLIAILLFASIFVAKVPSTDSLDGGGDEIAVMLAMPPSYTDDERLQVLMQVEQVMLDHASEFDLEHVVLQLRRDRGRDLVRGYFKPVAERQNNRDEVGRQLKNLIDPGPGVRWRVGWGSLRDGDGKSLRLTLRGTDPEVLRDLATQVVDRLEGVSGVISAQADVDSDSVRELHARLRPEAALRSGVGPALLGGSLSLALRGWRVTRIPLGGRDVEVLVRAAPHGEGRRDLGNLALSMAPSSAGDLGGAVTSGDTTATDSGAAALEGAGLAVALDQLTSFEEAPGFGAVYRENRETVVAIALTLDSDDIQAVRGEVQQRIDDVALPRGVKLDFGQRFSDLEGLQSDERFAALLAICFVFLLMGILFESWLLPLAVLACMPFAYTGAQWMLFVTGTPRDVMAMVGMVILIGIVVNNAIVLVDAINRARLQGLNRIDAITRAGHERLRPILMTALTTIGGLLPLALGQAQVAGISYAPLALAVIGGLVTSTALTLVVVPAAYVVLDDLGGLLRRTLHARTLPDDPSPPSDA
ncbi:MAG: efflux RND transporter permease subunit [Pseudomonadota bacterium]